MLDVNERLFISSLLKLMERRELKVCSLKEYQEEIGLDEEFFIRTVLSMERKKSVEIGFLRRNMIIKVKNWYTKYPDQGDFYLKITKRGLSQI